MRTLTAALGALSVLVAAGCGSTTNDEDTTGSGGSGSGTSGSGASGSGASGGGTSSSNGTGGSGACAAFADQAGLGTTTVRFTNDSPLPVYLPQSCSAISYQIRPTAGSDGVSYVYHGGCLQTCEDRQTNPPVYCGACPEQTRLVPVGGSVEVSWDGTGIRSSMMPADCYEGEPDPSCSQVIAAEANEYRVEITGYGACEGECTCNEVGECFGNASGAQAWADVVDFSHPGTSLVEVVFGPCAFGCGEN